MFRLPISNQNNHFKISYANVIRGPSISFTFKLLFYQHVRFYLIGVWVFGVRLFWAFDKTFHSFPIRGYFQWVSPVFIYLYVFFFLGWEQLGFFFFFFSVTEARSNLFRGKKVKSNERALSNPENESGPRIKTHNNVWFLQRGLPPPPKFFFT